MTNTISSAIQAALGHHQAGRLPQAEALYRQILQVEPNHPDALHLLGVLAHQSGQHAAAVELIGKATLVAPSAPMYYNLGLSFTALGRPDAAVDSYRKAISLQPDYAEAHGNLANILKDRGDLDAAVASYRKALSIKADFAEAHNNLGNALREQGEVARAIASYRKALAINPSYADAHINLGNAFHFEGQSEAAVECYRTALSLNPNSAEAHANLGNTLLDMGLPEAAANSCRNAISLKPDFAEAHGNLGAALQARSEFDAALECYRRALALQPGLARVSNNLGSCLQAQGKLDEAAACYREALRLNPEHAVAHSNLIFTLDLAGSVDTVELQTERKKWDAIHGAPWAAVPRNYGNDPDPERRLRIGYVSADFKNHSAATVFGMMLVHFDRSRFDVFAYSNTRNEDDLTRLFQQNVSGWRNIVGHSDDAVADMIRRDAIDILVDLSGHSAGNRLLVFARKPAPIQITAWGYATSTGMQAMDVFFADPVVVPPGEKPLFSERVHYLSNVVGYFNAQEFPAVNSLPALSASGITFGAFSRLTKMSDAAFSAWAEILLRVPDSSLILKIAELNDRGTRDRVMAHFMRAGIDPARIMMLGKTSWREHLTSFHQVDIGLDPFPHSGGVSSLESLMMGVPMVTLRGQTIVGRLSASILTTLGLPDWIAESPQQYVEIAVRKASDTMALSTLRGNLRGILTTSIIGDRDAYATMVESEYRQLWREWCSRPVVTN